MESHFSEVRDLFFVPGDIINQRYRIVELIGSGGMGSVYKAADLQLGRTIAIKVLHEVLDDHTARARFEREAMAISSLQHRNIVTFYGFGFHRDMPYIAMEYCPGRNLEETLAAERSLPVCRALDITVQVLEALDCAHRNGFMHRDLKPNNIILSEVDDREIVKVIDFGLAKPLPALGVPGQALTQEGATVGNLCYMSPEQCLGQPLDARADLYAVGCLLYHCITGRMPFLSEHPVFLMQQHVSEPASLVDSPLEDVPSAVRAIISRAMEKAPNARFQSAGEMIDAARTALSLQQKVVPKRPKSMKVPPPVAKVLPWTAGAVGCMCVGIAIFTLTHSGLKQSNQPSSAEMMRQVEVEYKQNSPDEIIGKHAHEAILRNESDHMLSQRREIEAYRIWGKSLITTDQKAACQVLGKAIALSEEHRIPFDPPMYDALSGLTQYEGASSQYAVCAEFLGKVLKERSKHEHPLDVVNYENSLRCGLACLYVKMGDIASAVDMLPPPSSPLPNFVYVADRIYVTMNSKPEEATTLGELYIRLVLHPRVTPEFRSLRAMQALVRANIACRKWSDAAQSTERLKQFFPDSELPRGVQLLFAARDKKWTDCDRLVAQICKRGKVLPQAIFADHSDWDLRHYAQLAREQGESERAADAEKRAEDLTQRGRKVYPLPGDRAR